MDGGAVPLTILSRPEQRCPGLFAWAKCPGSGMLSQISPPTMKTILVLALAGAAVLHAAPTVTLTDPAPSASVGSITSIGITFSEPVTGVLAGDFLINGEPAAAVTGSGAGPYVFSFPQPPAGTVTAGWDTEQVVSGIGTGPFVTPPAWTYALADSIPPVLATLPTSGTWIYGSSASPQTGTGTQMAHLLPAPGSVVEMPTQVEIAFAEAVTGVSAGDLLINGTAATALTGERAGPYRFIFPVPPAGTVNFTWAAGHGIADLAGNPFAGTAWNITAGVPGTVHITEFLALNAGASVMPGSDTDGVRDENWELSSWIELHNPGASSVNLLGWTLTDDLAAPAKWVFPSRTLAAGARLVVFASGKDRKPATGNLHTNFGLGGNGGTLAMFAPGAAVAASSWIDYPPQRYDYSYGALPADGSAHYFSPPSVTQAAYTAPNSDGQTGTPVTGPPSPAGSANSTTELTGVLAEPSPSVGRGFFNEPFAVILSGPAGATVRYTLDGSPPTAASTAFSAPLNVATTTVLRAACFAAGQVPSRTVTHTYLFPDHVCPDQPSPPYNHPGTAADDANPDPPAPGGSPLPIAWGTNSTFTSAATLPGFPSGTATGSNNLTSSVIPGLASGKIPADYGMDVKVWADPTRYNDLGAVDSVNGVTNRERIERSLRTLPALSVVIKSTDFFGTYPNGQDASGTAGNPALPLYPNSRSSVKTDMTKACSMELLQADGQTVFVVEAGIDLHGNASRDPFKNPKHGFTIRFKSKYGASKLEADLFPDSPVKQWDKLVLRGDFGGSWLHQSGADGSPVNSDSSQRPRGIRIREAFCKNSFRDMGRVASHHRFVNLFINGVCWGSYELMEDEAEDFTAAYMGGEKDLADVVDQKNDSVLNNRSASLKSGTWSVWSAMKQHLGWTGGSATMDRNVPPTATVLSYAWTNAQHETLKTMLDVPWFVDYMIWQTFAGHRDWANDNSDAARYMKNVYFVRPQDGKFRPMPWDMENLLWHESEDRITGATNSFNPSSPIASPSLAPPVLIHPRIKSNAEYRLEFADRAWRHLVKPGGALTAEENIARLDKWVGVVGPDAICLESARWGDYRYKVHAYSGGTTNQVYSWNGAWYDNSTAAQFNGAWAAGIMKFNTGRTQASQLGTYSGVGMCNAWFDEIRRLRTIYFPVRTSNVLAQYRTNGLYTHLNAPELRDNASNALLGDAAVAAGSLVKLTLPAAGTGSSSGEIFYTLDGSDPRPAYDQTGTPRAVAVQYSAPFAINGPTVVKARLRGGAAVFPQKADVRAATTASAGTYNATAGAAGRGQLTAAPSTLDGIALAAGDRILVKNHTTAAANGIYTVTTVGGGSTGVWDRAADWDANGDVVTGTWVRVDAGLTTNNVSTNEGGIWRVATNGSITVGGATGTAISFATQPFSPWSALMEITLQAGPPQPTVAISEIHYNPPSSQGGSAAEFVEFLNFGTLPVDMTSWYLNGIEFVFPAATVLQPGQRLVIASNDSPATFAAQHPGVVVLGYFGGSLSNGGERLSLLDSAGRIVSSVEFHDTPPWPTSPDNGGYSLELINPAGDLQSSANWRASTALKGTPGAANSAPPAAAVLISEFFAAGGQGSIGGVPTADFVEIYNSGGSPADVTGWTLNGTSLGVASVAAGQRVVVPFSGVPLDSTQGEILLRDAASATVDGVRYGPQLRTASFHRSGAAWTLGTPTPGTAGSPLATAAPTHLVLNEIMANPLPGEDDWLELCNDDAGSPVVLTGLALEIGGQSSTIAAPSAMAPGGYLRLWCDPGATRADTLNLAIPSSGGTLILRDTAWSVVATLAYGPQQEGVSQGLLNAVPPLVTLTHPSPGLENILLPADGPIFNEVLVLNENGDNNPWARRSSWVEIKNPAASSIHLNGWSLRTVGVTPAQWTFPSAAIAATGRLAVWCDAGAPASAAPGSHLNSGLALGNAQHAGFDASAWGIELLTPGGQVADRITWGHQIPDKSIGRLPNGTWTLLDTPTRDRANSAAAALAPVTGVKLNEWTGHAAAENFLELFNPAASPVSLGGLWLGDAPSESGRAKWQLPALSFIAPVGFNAYFNSGGGETNPARFHFNVASTGDFLRLSQNDASLTVVDSVSFGPSAAPANSQGRTPDGSASLASLVPTPGRSNLGNAALPTLTAWPFGQAIPAGQPVILNAVGSDFTAAQWFKDGSPIPGADGLILTLDPVTAATEGDYVISLTNAAGTVTSPPAHLTVLYAWDAWAAEFGLVSLNGDADNDGISNAVEFLAGSNPLTPDAAASGITAATLPGFLALEYTLSRRAALTAIKGQRSSDLALWTNAPNSTEELLSTQPNGDERLRVKFPIDPGEDRAFVRLSIIP